MLFETHCPKRGRDILLSKLVNQMCWVQLPIVTLNLAFRSFPWFFYDTRVNTIYDFLEKLPQGGQLPPQIPVPRAGLNPTTETITKHVDVDIF